MIYDQLYKLITEKMLMLAVYQPVMLMQLLRRVFTFLLLIPIFVSGCDFKAKLDDVRTKVREFHSSERPIEADTPPQVPPREKAGVVDTAPLASLRDPLKHLSAYERAVYLLSSEPLASISPESLLPIFALGGKGTELQRDNALRNIQGKVVSWKLKIYEIKKLDENTVGISTLPGEDLSSLSFEESLRMLARELDNPDYSTWILGQQKNRNVGALVYLTLHANEWSQLVNARTDDWIHIRGRLTGKSALRSLEISPAVLEGQHLHGWYQNILRKTTPSQTGEDVRASIPSSVTNQSKTRLATPIAPPSMISTPEEWISEMRSRLRSRIAFDPARVSGNPEVVFEIVLDGAGNVASVLKIETSGYSEWDEAVERSIYVNSPWIRMADGSIPTTTVTLAFRPK